MTSYCLTCNVVLSKNSTSPFAEHLRRINVEIGRNAVEVEGGTNMKGGEKILINSGWDMLQEMRATLYSSRHGPGN